MKFNEGFLAQMREATRMLHAEGPMAATAAIQRVLHLVGDEDGRPQHDMPGPHTRQSDIQPPAGATFKGHPGYKRGKWANPFSREAVEDVEVIDPVEAGKEQAGRFISASCTNHAGTRAYKIYIPSNYKEEALPLVVMLHGCTQNPDDFAAGTEMNKLAEENNFLVAYPAQSKSANANQCWNWFHTDHQRRDQGEPSILADITREISRTYKVDIKRVYVVGLSAGGAMAAVMAATYPELYAAIGIHSGLPYGSAHDIPSAFAAMKRRKGKAMTSKVAPRLSPLVETMPVIVFHGDRDTTVHPDNGEQALAQCVSAARAKGAHVTVQEGRVPNGHAYTRTIFHGSCGDLVAEKWIIHGAGHAWSGGDRRGSYTDPEGPSAAREMLRFFNVLEHMPKT